MLRRNSFIEYAIKLNRLSIQSTRLRAESKKIIINRKSQNQEGFKTRGASAWETGNQDLNQEVILNLAKVVKAGIQQEMRTKSKGIKIKEEICALTM